MITLATDSFLDLTMATAGDDDDRITVLFQGFRVRKEFFLGCLGILRKISIYNMSLNLFCFDLNRPPVK